MSIHVALIILGLFVVSCWRAPGPPWPNVGEVEIDLGSDFTGSGDSELITETITEAVEDIQEELEEQDSEVTEPTEEPVEEIVEEVATVETTDPVETVENGEPTESVESTTATAQPEPDPTPNAGTLYRPPSNSGGDGNNDSPGDEGSPDGTPAEESGGGDNGLVKIGGWSVDESPDFSGTIKHGSVMEVEIHINELGQVEQIIWIHSSLTPSEKKIIEQKFKSELKLSEIDGQKQETKGSYKIKFE